MAFCRLTDYFRKDDQNVSVANNLSEVEIGVPQKLHIVLVHMSRFM